MAALVKERVVLAGAAKAAVMVVARQVQGVEVEGSSRHHIRRNCQS